MKRFVLVIISIFILFAQSIIAQENEDVQVSIKLYNKTLYYPGESLDNPIYVHITVANKGSETLRFKLADDRMFSIDFSAFNSKNKKLPYTEEIIKKRTTDRIVYFREIALETGEEYSFVENLKDYVQITEPAIYYFELDFFPELYKSKFNKIESNRLRIDVKPSPSVTSVTKIPVSNETISVLKPETISPDKVVEQTIVARQKNLWDQFFLYMDIEKMLTRDQARKRKYTTLSDMDRNRMIQDYKLDLMQSRIDNAIVAIPESFYIEKTVYTQTEGSVSVIQWFKYDTFKEKKRYVYSVQKRDEIWHICDYTVENLGTE
jgi:hypothetical protein